MVAGIEEMTFSEGAIFRPPQFLVILTSHFIIFTLIFMKSSVILVMKLTDLICFISLSSVIHL